MTNRELATECIRRADQAMTQRKALLCAAVALGETKTIAAARRVLADPDTRIPGAIRVAALDLLTELVTTRQETTP
jgi:hypothetical protein